MDLDTPPDVTRIARAQLHAAAPAFGFATRRPPGGGVRSGAGMPDDKGGDAKGANGGSGGGDPDPPSAPVPEEVALVLAIASRRDRAAFVALFGRFAPRLKSWFRRGGASTEQAEELAQETMLAVWRKADSFDPSRAGAATWIFTIARNQRIDAIRRTPRRALDAEDPSLAPRAPAAPDAVFDTAQRERRLRDAMEALPAEQMEVIRLSFFEDRPHAEIERVLGIPLGTVKSRLRLAMNRLRAHLGDFGPCPPEGPPETPNGDRR